MKVLVACEESGTVRDAFLERGHDAWSCDLLPTRKPGPHHQCDAIHAITYGNWDLVIAHPDCTYLTCSAEWAYKGGPYHQKVKPGTLVGEERCRAREKALNFVRMILLSYDQGYARAVAVENPVGVISREIRSADQYIQPYEFGNDASKKTGLWLCGLPALKPTMRVQGRMVEYPKGSGKMVERWANQTDSGQNQLSPCVDRSQERSVTYQGIAEAMAEQWGGIIQDSA